MSDNPFAPLPRSAESEWDSRQHQSAANYYEYERQRCLCSDYREANPNYRPYQTAMESAAARHGRYARQLRASERVLA